MPPLRATLPFAGLNTQENESILAPNEATEALNINLNKGTIKRRDGWSEISDTTGIDTGQILGIYDFRRTSSGAAYLTNTLIKAGTSLWNRTDDSTAKIGNGVLTAGTLADFASFNNIAYIADAGSYGLKATDGTATFNAIITRPTDVPTVVVAGAVDAGSLTGVFDWKYTWYSADYEQESPASDVTDSIDGASIKRFYGQDATIGNLPDAVPDARDVDHWVKRIYRRNHTLGQTQWLFVGTAAEEDTTFTDNVPDHLVSNTEVAPLSVTMNLAGMRNIEEHGGVMFMARDDCDIFFSKPEQPWCVTEKLAVGGDAERGKITGLLSWKGLLYIFKEDSIWVLDGLIREQMTIKQVLNGVGCYSGHSIVSDDTGVYFLGEDAFYTFDGQQAVPISEPIADKIRDRNRQYDRFVVGVDDQENRSIMWNWSSNGQFLDECYVFFKVNSAAAEKYSWAKWKFVNSSEAALRMQYMERVTTNDDTADKKVWYGFNSGEVGEPDASGGDQSTDSNDGGKIESIWRTGRLDAGESTREKAWTTLYLEQEQQTNYSGLRFRYYRNGEDQYTEIDEVDPRVPVHYLRVRERGRDIKLEIYHRDESPMEVSTFTLDFEMAGVYHGER